jgi:hypothetical protein
MTITVVFDFPHDNLQQYDEVFTRGGAPIVDQPDRLHHQCFENGDGFTVIDVWANEQAFASFGEVLGPILQQVGLSTVPKVHRTHRIVTNAGELVDC